jgi:uncharacterized protein (DUF2252 family)
VVTDDDFGLADFDNAGYGPAIVDLVRYAASLHLACREVEGGCDPEAAVSAFFDAYRAALDRPVPRSQPAIVARCAPVWARTGGVAAVGRRPDPAARSGRGGERPTRMVPLRRADARDDPGASRELYRIIRLGSVEIGLGSALERKLLTASRAQPTTPATT